MDLYEKLRNMKLLLIDDDEWIRDSLSIFFESEGCYLKAFETAEEGLEALKKQPYDIIIVDYRLPGMDGLDFLKRINKFYPNLKKILITAYENKALVSEAMQLGIQDFIEKPFTTKTIEASLSMLIENREREGSVSYQINDQKTKEGDLIVMYEIKIDTEKCTGCGECVDICPDEVYELQDEKSIPVNAEECSGCESCVEVCEEEAITVMEV